MGVSAGRTLETSPDAINFHFLTGGRAATRILAVEHRGIQIAQLQQLVEFLRRRVRRGGAISGWRDPCSGKQLRLQSMNLYNAVHWVIRPLTQPQGCSYVEAIAEQAALQIPTWFVSHWWGEALLDFVACLQVHQQTRMLPNTSAYWICAYANNQHELANDLAKDPTESSFMKAMQISDGIFLILDPASTPFTRIWCCFEVGVVTLAKRGILNSQCADMSSALRSVIQRDGCDGRKQGLLLDIGTASSRGGAQVLSDCPCASDERNAQQFSFGGGASAVFWKFMREQTFPTHILLRGLDVGITSAEASVEGDRFRILNALAGEPPGASVIPNLESEKYDKINKALRGMFAEVMWHRVLQPGSADFAAVARVMVEDLTRKELTLQLSGVLKDSNQEQFSSVLAQLCNLQHLHLVLDGCRELSDIHTLSVAVAQLSSLLHLNLSLSQCSLLTNLDALAAALPQLRRLKNLVLNFSGFQQTGWMALTTITAMEAALGGLPALEQLTLLFQGCPRLTSIEGLAQGISQAGQLRKLVLSFSSCEQLSDVAVVLPLRQALVGRTAEYLTELTLHLPSGQHIFSLEQLQGLA